MPHDLPLETVASCITRRRLHLILLPTEACNFRCVYCYETFRQKRMSPEVVAALKRLIRRRIPALDDLELSWFGGEPLLARDIIEDVLLDVREHARNNPNVRVRSDATTNAYLLTAEVFRRLLALGLESYQISFDGPREHHDRKRVLAGGKGTFDRIWGNVTAMSREPGRFHVLVRVHVDRENEAAMPEFIEMYRAAFGTDPRFELFLRPLSRLGGP
ncbi:MAG TPA: radical SAM protein, partial [Candidatus Eisenbacteria bacterium]|nr:radical SAM protein [Candidatus Eisenbacteria bacterium]